MMAAKKHPSPPRKARRPGRPAGDGARRAREAIVGAARRLFLAEGFAAVSMRRIAEAAGVTPAMIHYYFKGKDGLYQAVFEETAAPVFRKLRALTDRPGDAGEDIRSLLRTYMRVLSENPWVRQLILREVLDPRGSFRDSFVKQLAGPAAGRLKQLLAADKADGQLRSDLDVELAALSLVSMAVFPFLAAPVVAPVFGFEPGEADIDRLARHTERLFLAGVRREPD